MRPAARALLLLLPVLLTAALLYLPDPGLQRLRFGRAGVVISDRFGEELYSIPGEGGSYLQRLGREELPQPVRQVFLRLEDKRFHAHRGLDPLAAARALLVNLRQGRIVSGASTISMQLARLASPHRGGLPGKLRELFGALRLEARLGKQQILLLYLNNLPFGYNTRGVGAAARIYFDRPLAELSRAQVLLLAVIPKAPSLYDPFGSAESRTALARQARSLAALVSVDEAELERALATFRRGEPVLRAPHFVRFVLEELERPGGLATGLEDLEIARLVTTLDAALYRDLLARLRSRLAEAQPGPAAGVRGAGPANAAALVLASGSGQVLAWVGSQDFFDRENGGEIDGVRARFSSGSTLKPVLYALALESGFSPAALLPDLAMTFGAEEGYRPENFDRRSRGLVRLRTALASSLNVPAVYLLSRIGLEEFLDRCRQLDIGLPLGAAARYGLGAAIGNVEVSLLELSRAFGVFANRGLLPPLGLLLEVRTVDGRRIAVESPGVESPGAAADSGGAAAATAAAPGAAAGRASRSRRVFREETAWLIADILSDAAARASGFGIASRFNTAFPALFKSGTASGYASLWCLGAHAGYTVGVWAGNFDGRPAFGSTGSSLPAAIAVETLERLAGGPGGPAAAGQSAGGPRTAGQSAGGPGAAFPGGGMPAALAAARICTLSGYRSSPACPATREEYFSAGSEPLKHCPLHAGGMSMEQLVLEVLLEGEKAPQVLFPRKGSVFFRDRSAAGSDQLLQAWIAARPDDTLQVYLNGRPLNPADPSLLLLPVTPGRYRLEVQGRHGRDAVEYAVR